MRTIRPILAGMAVVAQLAGSSLAAMAQAVSDDAVSVTPAEGS